MTEPPERIALRKLLVRLKAKSIASESAWKESWKSLAGFILGILGIIGKYASESKDLGLREAYNRFLIVSSFIDSHHKQSAATIDNLLLYIESLEDAYEQLDETFEKAVYEPARKQADAEIKEQNEMSLKTKPKFYG